MTEPIRHLPRLTSSWVFSAARVPSLYREIGRFEPCHDQLAIPPLLRRLFCGQGRSNQFGYPPQGIPSFAGYTFGYRLVQAYLERTGSPAAEATYRPWEEIVAESRFF
jgi:hypothetical protein